MKATKAVPIEAQIVSAARATSVPIWPKKGPWTALASIAAFLLGAVGVVTGALISGAAPPSAPKAARGSKGIRAGKSSAVGDAPALAAAAAALEASVNPKLPVSDPTVIVPAASAQSANKGAAAKLVAKMAAKKTPEKKSAAAATAASAPKSGGWGLGKAQPPTEDFEQVRADAIAAGNRNMTWDQLATGLADSDDEDVDPTDPMHALAYRMVDRGGSEPGYRVLVTGETDAIDCAAEAVEIVSVLRSVGRMVVLVDWNLDGQGISAEIGLANRTGLTDFITGRAQLSEVVIKLPGTDAHILPCGRALDTTDATLDADQIAAALDSLDEHYHQIIITGRHDDARDLFQAIQGRFDCGVTIGERADPAASPNVFLGFEVADIDVVRHDRSASAAAAGAATAFASVAASARVNGPSASTGGENDARL